MKKFISLKKFTFVIIFAFALFAVSCDKSDDGILPNYSEDANLKSGHLPGKAVKKTDMTIAEIVVASTNGPEPQFTLLLAALEYAGLTGVFAGNDQYTVFAPTDQAFLALVTALGVDPNDPFTAIDVALGEGTVANVLLYHVTYGRRAANSVVPKNKPRMIETLLEGASFKVDNQKVIWAVGNTANIVTPNISASNGIIHVIDAVILPIELP